MNHHRRKVLHSLFAHPIGGNVAMKDVEAVFRELGAETNAAHSGKLHVTPVRRARLEMVREAKQPHSY